jgi:hypothetical protein
MKLNSLTVPRQDIIWSWDYCGMWLVGVVKKTGSPVARI